MDYENDTSKSVAAYGDKKTAISRIKKLNAQDGENKGNPYFVRKKVIDD